MSDEQIQIKGILPDYTRHLKQIEDETGSFLRR